MPQSLILLKKLPDPDYLHNLQAEGVYRASMNFLPGGCYEGAALWDASPVYATSGTLSSDSTAASGCPTPEDPVSCELWEIFELIHRFSFVEPMKYNAFLFAEVAPSQLDSYFGQLREVTTPYDADAGFSDGPAGPEYVAAGSLIGCGTYNVAVEVLASEHDRLLEVLHRATAVEGVRQYSVGRLRADDTRGFGEQRSEAAAP